MTAVGPDRPAFGRAMLGEWPLDPSITYLNHGTVGVAPKRVLAAQHALHEAIERQPSQFLLRELSGHVGRPTGRTPLLRAAAHRVARFLGARGEDFVFVENVTAGANAVLASVDLAAGDEIVVTDLAYGGVLRAAQFVARRRGAVLRTVETPWPVTGPDAIADAIERALGPRTRLAFVDHITSQSALVLPGADIVARCHARGVPVLVDGAHAPGQVALDLPALGADWYTGNLHKWACAPRSCAFLWAAPERQPGLHPPVVSWGLDQGFTAEFDWTGTRDPVPFLVAPEGIAYLEGLGIEAVRGWNHALAWQGALLLAERWGTGVGSPESMVGSMVTVPLPAALGGDREAAAALRDALLFEDRIEVPVHAGRGRLWTRVSAQVYNERADIEQLAGAVLTRT